MLWLGLRKSPNFLLVRVALKRTCLSLFKPSLKPMQTSPKAMKNSVNSSLKTIVTLCYMAGNDVIFGTFDWLEVGR